MVSTMVGRPEQGWGLGLHSSEVEETDTGPAMTLKVCPYYPVSAREAPSPQCSTSRDEVLNAESMALFQIQTIQEPYPPLSVRHPTLEILM